MKCLRGPGKPTIIGNAPPIFVQYRLSVGKRCPDKHILRSDIWHKEAAPSVSIAHACSRTKRKRNKGTFIRMSHIAQIYTAEVKCFFFIWRNVKRHPEQKKKTEGSGLLFPRDWFYFQEIRSPLYSLGTFARHLRLGNASVWKATRGLLLAKAWNVFISDCHPSTKRGE